MTAPAAAQIRPALPADLPALARFIAALNAMPQSECLHCAAKTPAEARAALREEFGGAEGWTRAFVVASRDDPDGGPPVVLGALGCQLDPSGGAGWLWGPWVVDSADAVGARLFARLETMLPPSARRVDAFLNAENARGLQLLRSQGFSLRQRTHIYVAPRGAASAAFADDDNHETPVASARVVAIAELRLSQETAFARLHEETFPAGESARAEDLLAGRDDEHRIFAAADGLRLLGYVCVSVNRAPREGFIDYLAVRESARGRGVGRRLLRAAQRWTFEERGLPQAALCVSDWRSGARRLYERAGFSLYASGVGARWTLRR